jgi:hypothetical protein
VICCTRSGAGYGCGITNLAAGASVTFPVHLLDSGNVGATTTSGDVYIKGCLASSARRRQVPPGCRRGADNTASTTASVVVACSSDLARAVSPAPTVAAGQPFAVPVQVSNLGIGVSGATTVETTLPAGFIIVYGASSLGACTAVGQVVSCPIDVINPGGNQSIAVNATASSTSAAVNTTVIIDPTNLVPERNETKNSAAVRSVVSEAFTDPTTSISGPSMTTLNGKPVYP